MGISESVLPFKLELSDDSKSKVTAFAGLPVVIEALRAAVPDTSMERLAKTLGYGHADTARRALESLVLLMAQGGDCIDDVRVLRADSGLSALLGFTPLSPAQLKDFLYRFGDGRKIDRQPGAALLPAPSTGLQALAKINDAVIQAAQVQIPYHRATVDVDATIVEAHKKEALMAYEGTVGYQPQMAYWAERKLFLHSEFRDGNVPAGMGVPGFLHDAFARLPKGITQKWLRGDSALYVEMALLWADAQGIEFAVSADMSQPLHSAVLEVPKKAWQPYRNLAGDDLAEEREWAWVNYDPGWKRPDNTVYEPFRYLAIRVRSRQMTLEGIPAWRHFAVVTNMGWEGERLLRWHREKQGTVEHGHAVMKNELASGVLPCGRFFANAAWWDIGVLVHNLLRLLQLADLPEALRNCRPKALRFRLFALAGRLIRHARQWCVRVAASHPFANALPQLRRTLATWRLTLAPPE